MWKELLALTWHSADAALDAADAPRRYRLGLALIGVAWSAFWFVDKLTRVDLTETNRLVSERIRPQK